MAHHYPEIPNLGDMTQLKQNKIYNETDFNLLVGGTPCQSFSVAGLRKGLSDERGNLSLEFVRILIDKQPDWFLWENVPGVLSSGKGADFASILSAFTGRSVEPQKFGKSGIIEGDPDSENGAGYSIAYRILDSRYFGVPQRRRRVFVVGYRGKDWRPPFAVLFERESLRRDFTPSKIAGQGIADEATRSPGRDSELDPASYGIPGNWIGRAPENGGNAIEPMNDVSPCLTKTDRYAVVINTTNCTKDEIVGCLCASDGEKWGANQWVGEGKMIVSEVVQGDIFSIQSTVIGRKDENGPRGPGYLTNESFTLTKTDLHAVAMPPASPGCFTQNTRDEVRYIDGDGNSTGALMANGGEKQTFYLSVPRVRRLTPLEYERLQGFPDNYTKIPGASDSNMYKACGNSMTRNVMQWLGERIDKVDKLIKELKACAPPVIEVVVPIYDDSYKSYLDPNRNR